MVCFWDPQTSEIVRNWYTPSFWTIIYLVNLSATGELFFDKSIIFGKLPVKKENRKTGSVAECSLESYIVALNLKKNTT
jgi:hypothetical protein